jgi:hypothetical protein
MWLVATCGIGAAAAALPANACKQREHSRCGSMNARAVDMQAVACTCTYCDLLVQCSSCFMICVVLHTGRARLPSVVCVCGAMTGGQRVVYMCCIHHNSHSSFGLPVSKTLNMPWCAAIGVALGATAGCTRQRLAVHESVVLVEVIPWLAASTAAAAVSRGCRMGVPHHPMWCSLPILHGAAACRLAKSWHPFYLVGVD